MGWVSSMFKKSVVADVPASSACQSKDAPFRIVLHGLHGAGKSSLLRRMQDPDCEWNDSYLVTIGLDFAKIVVDSSCGPVDVQIWDQSGGRERFRALERRMLRNVARLKSGNAAVAFIVDSVDASAIAAARGELAELASDPDLTDAGLPFFVLATKRDMDGALSLSELKAALELSHINAFPVFLHGVSAKTGAGVKDAVDAIVSSITVKKAGGCDVVDRVVGDGTKWRSVPLLGDARLAKKVKLADLLKGICVAFRQLL